jgi:hypothetical protein
MGFRFHKRLRIIPGLWLNISKKGGSLSVGGRGATINVNREGHQETVGLPGSGLSYRTKRRKFRNPGVPARATLGAITGAHIVYLVVITIVILWIILTHLH